MKLLIYSHLIPYPLNQGGTVAQFYILEALSYKADITFVTQEYQVTKKVFRHFKEALPRINIRVIKKSKNKILKSSLSAILKNLKYRFSNPLINKKKSSKDFHWMNIIDPRLNYDKNFYKQFLKIINEIKPDCIQIDFIENAIISNVIPINIPRVLIIHEIRFESIRQILTVSHNSVDNSDEDKISFFKLKELSLYDLFSQLIVFHSHDKEVLEFEGVQTSISVIPFAIKNKVINIIDDTRFLYKYLIFIGPSHHYPNKDAIFWYANELHDTLYFGLNFILYVIGEWSDSDRRQFSSYKGIVFLGFVSDLSSVYKNSIMIVPLRIGSGLRVKILEAFNEEVPVISTSIGCQGIPSMNKENIYIADSVDQFFEGIHFLCQPPNAQNQIRIAKQYIVEKYYPDTLATKRHELYQSLITV
jgi:hypothetical protein